MNKIFSLLIAAVLGALAMWFIVTALGDQSSGVESDEGPRSEAPETRDGDKPSAVRGDARGPSLSGGSGVTGSSDRKGQDRPAALTSEGTPEGGSRVDGGLPPIRPRWSTDRGSIRRPGSPRLSGGDPLGREDSTREPVNPKSASGGSGAGSSGAESSSSVYRPPAGSPAAASIEQYIALAEQAYRQGNDADATMNLRKAFTQGQRAQLGSKLIVPVSLRLLETDQDPGRRPEYLQYLLENDRDGLGVDLLLDAAEARIARRKRSRSRGSDSVPRDALPSDVQAWEELSWAYRLASDELKRQQVLDVLDPFIQQRVFDKRYSDLLTGYKVREGDNLSRIARKFSTTVDAIKRLSSLENDTIHPGTRVKVLPGEVEVHVDKSDYRLWLTIDGRVFLERRVGIGVDNSTPVGTFVVSEKQKDPIWYQPGEQIPAGDPRNVLGTRWIGFEDTDEVSGIGIHGTLDNNSLGKESSQGCIRMRREDVELVFDFIPRGAKVTIRD